jgi:hypothetical protein
VQRVVSQQDRASASSLVQRSQCFPRRDGLEHRADHGAADHPILGSDLIGSIGNRAQDLRQVRPRGQGQFPGRLLATEAQMGVHVDQTGHDQLAPGVEHLGIGAD